MALRLCSLTLSLCSFALSCHVISWRSCSRFATSLVSLFTSAWSYATIRSHIQGAIWTSQVAVFSHFGWYPVSSLPAWIRTGNLSHFFAVGVSDLPNFLNTEIIFSRVLVLISVALSRERERFSGLIFLDVFDSFISHSRELCIKECYTNILLSQIISCRRSSMISDLSGPGRFSNLSEIIRFSSSENAHENLR